MIAFSNIPAHSVMPLGDMALDEVRRAAYRAEQRYLHVDLKAVKSKADALAAIGTNFGFGDHFGKNLDALFDSLTDLKPEGSSESPGFVVVLENWPTAAKCGDDERQIILDVFRDAAEFFFDKDIAFRVFYSVQAAKKAA